MDNNDCPHCDLPATTYPAPFDVLWACGTHRRGSHEFRTERCKRLSPLVGGVSDGCEQGEFWCSSGDQRTMKISRSLGGGVEFEVGKGVNRVLLYLNQEDAQRAACRILACSVMKDQEGYVD